MSELISERPALASYHWIITFQWGNGYVNTADGSFSLPPGATRAKMYRAVHDQMAEDTRRRNPSLAGLTPMVLFFSLERDELGAPEAGPR